MVEIFEASVVVPVDSGVAFRWHERVGAFARLTPPWERVRLLEHTGGLRDGARVVVEVGLLGPVRLRPVYRHVDYEAGVRFVDEQVSGPFRHWRHEHRFEAVDGGRGCRLTDRIEFVAPTGSSGMVRRRLERMFAYRHRIFAEDMGVEKGEPLVRPMTIVITGGTGLIGSALRARLTTRGHTVRVLTRSPSGDGGEFGWDPKAGEVDERALENIDAVIHLAGANIAQRWTLKNRCLIVESREASTRLIAERLLNKMGVSPLPRILSASGINYYGAVSGKRLDETAGPGSGFLAEVCSVWENAWTPLREAGATVIPVRTGIVLDPRGGALAKLLPPFRWGLGGPIGRGGRMMSWIGLEDAVEVYRWLLENDLSAGPVNAVAPDPVSNRTFSDTLGRVLKRPVFCPVPPALLKLGLGQMAEETILGDLKVAPVRLTEGGFRFRAPELEPFLRSALGQPG